MGRQDVMIGKTIGQYKIIDKIGEGGMGAVYKAEDTTLHRLVAIKTLSGHLTENEEAQERFIREAQSASSLNHPNITTVHEFIEEDDTRLICMEYVEGKTIRDMVESGIVSVRKAIDIITQAAEALEAAHNKGILHRDVKSANIMVNMEGRVKVMDFGLAHLESRSQLTRTGTTMGTLSYSSPEQISGRSVDKRSEIFSLGVVFYELLTGQLPFKATNEAEILFAIINNEPPKLSEVRDDVPKLVEAVIARMLEKDPDLRYQNCGDVINDIKGIRKEMETSTVSITGTLDKLQTERKGLLLSPRWLGIAIAFLVVVAGAIVLTSDSGPPPEQVIVAVFENRTGDPSLDPLCQQISETIAEEIDAIDFLTAMSATVLSATQLRRIQQGTDPLVRLGRQTGSGTVVTGAVYLDGVDGIRIQTDITVLENTDLITPPDPIISSRAEISRSIELLSDRVAARIAAAFDTKLLAWYSGGGPPPTLDAYRFLLQAGEQYLQRNWGEVIALYLLAAETDTSFRSPLLWVAIAYLNMGLQAESDSVVISLQSVRSQLNPFEQTYLDWLTGNLEGNLSKQYQASSSSAEVNATWSFQAGYDARRINRPAEAVDFLQQVPKDSIVRLEWPSYWSRLIESYYILGDHRRGLKAAREARKLFTQSWSFLQEEIRALAALGRTGELRRLIDQSYAFPGTGNGSPGGSIRRAAIELRARGHLEEAALLFEEALSWYQSQPLEEQHELGAEIALTYSWADHRDDARQLYLRLHDENPLNRTNIRALGCLAARDGDIDEAHRYLEELGALQVPARSWGYILNDQAAIAASLGEQERAMTLLRQAFQAGYAFSPDLHRNIDFDPIRDFPPFQEWIRPKG